MIVRETESQFEPAPEGTYQAVCIGVIDLGTHYSEFYQRRQHKLLLQWELPEERVQFTDNNGMTKEMPAVVSQQYNATLGSGGRKSKLREHLEMWRGKGFSQQEIDGFDTKVLLGMNCMLTIVHNESNQGTKFANVAAITRLPKGMLPAEPAHDLRYYSFDKDIQIPDNITGRLRDKIMAADEWLAPPEDGQSSSVISDDEFPHNASTDTGVPF